MVPPRLIRRLVLAPLVIVIALGFIVLSPFLALAALVSGLLARPKAGRMRSLRLVGFALVWLVAETVALIALTGLWVVSGFGGRLRTEPYQSRHYGVMRWFLDTMYRGAERTYGLRVEVDEPDLTGDELAARLTRPVIVLSRHAGPGDSFLLVHQLLSLYHRRPRVVMKAALQLDPSVDIVGNRLPNVWVKSRQVGEHIFTEQITRLARGLDERGALVIFPEGGNWTPSRWRRGIRRLEHLGRPDLAERARDMPNLLPPRPGGALAAIAACPDADVIFVAHAGLDNIITVADVWSKFPVDQVIRARWWRVPDDSVPRSADYEVQVQWLYGWWERIDAWITENRPGMVLAPLSGDEPAGPAGELPAGSAPRCGSRLNPGSLRCRSRRCSLWGIDRLGTHPDLVLVTAGQPGEREPEGSLGVDRQRDGRCAGHHLENEAATGEPADRPVDREAWARGGSAVVALVRPVYTCHAQRWLSSQPEASVRPAAAHCAVSRACGRAPCHVRRISRPQGGLPCQKREHSPSRLP